MSDSAQKTSGQHDLDQDELLALAAADAIKRLIAERNALRDQSAAQPRAAAAASNEKQDWTVD